MLWEDNYLAHHGIKGQQWGIRRFQNKDGSLTPEGKERYYTKDEIRSAFNKKIESESKRAESIIGKGQIIIDEANTLGDKYKEEFKKIKENFSDDDKKHIWNKLHQDFGVGSDDKEFFDMLVEENIINYVKSKADKKLESDIKKFKSAQDDYWADINSFTSDFLDAYKDAKIVELSLFGKKVTNEKIDRMLINNEIGKGLGSRIPAYIYRHFEDYWVNDNGLYKVAEELASSFTMDDYNQRYGK